MTLVTIQTGSRSSAQGLCLAQHPDGRITVSTGRGTLTGWPIPRPTPTRLTPARLTPMGL